MAASRRRVSFIVLVCDHAPRLAKALRAALDQDCPALEIVIWDDASVDRSPGIIAAVLAAYRGPHAVVTGRNSRRLGPAGHINAAVARATGEIIVMASAADIADPSRASRLVAALDASGSDLVVSNARLTDPAGAVIGLASDDRTTRAISLTDQTDRLQSILADGAAFGMRRAVLDAFGSLDLARAPVAWGHQLAWQAAILGGCTYLGTPLLDRLATGSPAPGSEAIAAEAAMAAGLATRLAQLHTLRNFMGRHDDRPELVQIYRRLQGRIVLSLYDWTLARNALRRTGLRPTWHEPATSGAEIAAMDAQAP